ncbi:MAG: hypothetical protein ACYCXK_07145 [Candidatus Humimicrobiaceae bacterium]
MEEKKISKKPRDSKLTKKGFYIFIAVFLLLILVFLFNLMTPATDLISFFIGLSALWGYIFLAAACIITPFLKEVLKYMGKPFIKIHHIFAFTGLSLITLHPILVSARDMTLKVFVLDFTTWISFWTLAGRPALYVIWIAFLVILFRRKIKPWRIIHAFMFLSLLMGFIHAILSGTDFKNMGIIIIYSILFILVITAFVLKRMQLIKVRNLKAKNKDLNYEKSFNIID